MSIAVMNWIWQTSISSGTELLIELALADFANDQGECWPSVATVAKKARCSDRNVQRKIADMVAKGRLEVREQASANRTNIYVFTGSEGDKLSPLAPAPADQRVTNPAPEGDKKIDQRVTKQTPEGDTAMSPDPPKDPSVRSVMDPSGRSRRETPESNVLPISDLLSGTRRAKMRATPDGNSQPALPWLMAKKRRGRPAKGEPSTDELKGELNDMDARNFSA